MPRDADIPAQTTHLTKEARIQVLLEEYRALYALLTFRLSAMDRRLPVAGGMLWGLLATIPAMPAKTQVPFLLGLPAALMWLLLSTVQHAKSKEDHLRRIDEIERLVNGFAREELLVFQSRHPNKRARIGGRTGNAAVLGVFSACSTILAGGWYFAVSTPNLLPPDAKIAFFGYSALIWLVMASSVLRARRYRYQRPPPTARPLFEAHGLEKP